MKIHPNALKFVMILNVYDKTEIVIGNVIVDVRKETVRIFVDKGWLSLTVALTFFRITGR